MMTDVRIDSVMPDTKDLVAFMGQLTMNYTTSQDAKDFVRYVRTGKSFCCTVEVYDELLRRFLPSMLSRRSLNRMKKKVLVEGGMMYYKRVS